MFDNVIQNHQIIFLLLYDSSRALNKRRRKTRSDSSFNDNFNYIYYTALLTFVEREHKAI